MNFVSDEQITVSSTSIGLNIPATAIACYVEIWTASIYYSLDAVLPSSSNGGRASPGDTINLMGSGEGDSRVVDNMRSVMENLRMIRQGSSDALAIAHYFY